LSSDIRKDQISGMAQELASEIEKVLRVATRTCVNCEHFNGTDEICKADLAKRRPPARVIAFGCDVFSPDIPF